MAFAGEIQGLPFSPYVFDVVLMYCYSKEAAEALYEEIMEAASQKEENDADNKREDRKSVSYTHLDVYKRQIWQPCGAGARTSSRPTMGCLDSRMHGEGKRVFWDRFLSKWS